MILGARAVRLTSEPVNSILLYARRSRSFHTSVVKAAKVQSRKSAKAVKQPTNARQTDARASGLGEASEICEKLQVLPFNLSPEKALKQAMGHSCAWLSHDKLGGSTLQLVWQYARAGLGFSSSLVLPGLKGVKAIYLPIWKLDYVCRLKAERDDSAEYTWEIEVLDGNLIGTHVEPLASLPNVFSKIGDLAGAMEPYDPRVHHTIPKSDDYTIEAVSSPIRVAFSRFPPDINRVHKAVTRQFNHDTVKFTGQGETPFVAAYPILLPCYLFELYDRSAANSKTESSSITCLVLGRDLPKETLPIAVCQDAIWRPKRKTREIWSTTSRIFPTVLTFDAQIVKSMETILGKPPSTLFKMILRNMRERFFPKLAEKERYGEVRGIHRDLLPDLLQKLKDDCEHVSSNAKLVEVKRRLNEKDWIMSYSKHAKQNKEYLKATADVRLAEHRVAIAEVKASFESHTAEAVHTSQAVKRLKLKAEAASSTEGSETFTLDEAYTELRAAKARLEGVIPERVKGQ